MTTTNKSNLRENNEEEDEAEDRGNCVDAIADISQIMHGWERGELTQSYEHF